MFEMDWYGFYHGDYLLPYHEAYRVNSAAHFGYI